MLPIHSILVPTDFTNHSIAAFHVAAALARDHQANLLVLHVRETPVAPFAQFGAVPPPGVEPRSVMMDKLGQFKLIDGAISTEYLLVDGAPALEIVRVATDRHCDLIVMGTHGRTGLGRLLMGSVAQQVMRTAPCPVLTLRRPLPAAEELQTWPEMTTAFDDGR